MKVIFDNMGILIAGVVLFFFFQELWGWKKKGKKAGVKMRKGIK